jgi:hypothetical protein
MLEQQGLCGDCTYGAGRMSLANMAKTWTMSMNSSLMGQNFISCGRVYKTIRQRCPRSRGTGTGLLEKAAQPGLCAESAPLHRGADPARARELRMRIEPGTRSLGARGRNSRADCPELCRHFPQQLHEEWAAAHRPRRGHCRSIIRRSFRDPWLSPINLAREAGGQDALGRRVPFRYRPCS